MTGLVGPSSAISDVEKTFLSISLYGWDSTVPGEEIDDAVEVLGAEVLGLSLDLSEESPLRLVDDMLSCGSETTVRRVGREGPAIERLEVLFRSVLEKDNEAIVSTGLGFEYDCIVGDGNRVRARWWRSRVQFKVVRSTVFRSVLCVEVCGCCAEKQLEMLDENAHYLYREMGKVDFERC